MKLRLFFGVLCALGLLGSTAAGDDACGSVAVTIQDPGGAPVAGARVSARAEPGGHADWWSPRRLALAVTNERGVALLTGLRPKVGVTLVITAPDARWRELADAWRSSWKPAATTIRMKRTQVLKGVVRGPSGGGVPYAAVHCQVGAWSGEQSAGADGAFVFENLPPGNAALHAELAIPRGTSLTGPEVRCAIDGRAVVLALPEAPRQVKPCLLVRLTTPGGRPIPKAEAHTHGRWVERSARGVTSHSYSGGSSPSGCAVRLFQEKGRMHLTISAARTELGEPLPFGPVRSGALGRPPGEVTLKMVEGLTIEGRVLDDRGVGAAGVEVRAAAARGTLVSRDSSSWDSSPHGFGVSGADGSFRVEGLEKRNYRLEALPTSRFLPSSKGTNVPDGPRVPMEAPPGTGEATGVPAAAGARDVVVYVRDTAQPTLTVVGDDGKPLRNALVRVLTIPSDEFFSPVDAWPQQRTDARGEARFEALDPDLFYELKVEPPENQKDLMPWIVKSWRPTDAKITLGKPRSIAGVVQAPDGTPIPEANLRYVMSNGPQDARGESKAGPDGRFEWKGLRPGDYCVSAWPPDRCLGGSDDRAVQGRPVTVKAGDVNVVLNVTMPTTLAIRLPNWSRKLGSAKARLVCVSDGDPAVVEKKVPKDGLLTFESVDWRKTYLLWIGPLKKGRNAYLNPAGPVIGTLDVPIRAGRSLSGRVKAPRGTKSKKIYVVYPGFEIKGKVDARGRFKLEGLPPGPWKLRATGKIGTEVVEATVEAKPGEEAVIQLGSGSDS